MKRRLRLEDVLVEKRHRSGGTIKYDVQLYLNNRRKVWVRMLKTFLKKHKSVKYDIRLEVRLQKREENDVYIYSEPCFRSMARILFARDDVEESVNEALEQILDAYDVYMKKGSGWVLDRVMFSQINVYRYQAIGGGGYKPVKKFRQSVLPESLVKNTNSILTMRPTPDGKCFLHCILAALFPLPSGRQDRTRPKAYLDREKELNTDGLRYPVTLEQIPGFEQSNGLVINVVALDEDEKMYFAYKSRASSEKVVNLLLYNDHYSLITSWGCFLNYSGKNKRILCKKCGNFFRSSAGTTCETCQGMEETGNLVFLEKGSKQKFTNFKNVSPQPFVYYCDLETVLVPNEVVDECAKMKKTKIHQPIAIGLLRCCTEKKYQHKRPIIHAGKDCIEKFYETLKKEIAFMDEILSTVNHPLDMTPEQEEAHLRATNCYVCEKLLASDEKMRDHNHLKRRENYLGAACNECNLNRTDLKLKRTPLIFHNGGRFDIHFLIQKLHVLDQPITNIIGKTGENIMCMELFGKRLVVVDSMNHLSSSLSSLVDMLQKSGKPLPHTERMLKGDQIGLKLMSRKGVFPYDYVDCEEALLETKELPDREKFYDELQERELSEEDYDHARSVWQHFDCKSLWEYMMVYLKSDITLLADVFENYRRFFEEKFSLDCTKYLSLPSLSYDCMLKFTKCKLDQVSDREIYEFLKRGLRGGVSMIPLRYAKANNPGLKCYDPGKPISHLIYLDCNALYSSIMTKKLPYKKLSFVDMKKDEVLQIVQNYDPESKKGYMIECDLTYPPDIHDLTRDLPLAPEHRKVSDEMLSPMGEKLKKELDIADDKSKKLLSTQYDKEQYVCHVENLQFYLQMGMKLVKVHKVLEFKQKAIFKPYVELCIRERNREVTSSDEKAMWKLCCNAIFGKTITNPEKKTCMKLVSDAKKVLNAVKSSRFKHADVINSRIVQVTGERRKNLINTPYYAGVAILELSKLLLMKMHYEHFMKKYGRFKLRLCMTDTDSLLYHIQTENLYEELRDMGIVEFSNYPEDHPCYDKTNGGKLFYLKDESAGKPIKCFVGLRAKSYSVQYDDEKYNKMVGKGVPRSKLRSITHEDMLKVLETHLIKNVMSNQLRSFKHTMFSIRQEKVALSPFDNKRYVCQDGINTLPYGHIDIQGELRKKRKREEYEKRLRKTTDNDG